MLIIFNIYKNNCIKCRNINKLNWENNVFLLCNRFNKLKRNYNKNFKHIMKHFANT